MNAVCPKFEPNSALTSAALNTAQRYHIDAGRRHRAGAHLSGVVDGLNVMVDERAIRLMPGYAVDTFGRDLVVTEEMDIGPLLDVALAQQPQSDMFDVLLNYQQIVKNTGWQAVLDETPRPELRASGEPSETALPDVVKAAPDDPAARSPVRLGVLQQDEERSGNWTFVATTRYREEAGLVAAAIAPARDDADSRLELAQESFAVLLKSEVDEEDVRRLVVDPNGARIRGALTVDGGVEIASQLVLTTGAPATDASPGFYRIGDPQSAADTHELRLVLPPQGALAIGAWNPQSNKFEPVLTVDARTRSVTITGDLIVEGAKVTPDGVDALPPKNAANGQDTQGNVMQGTALASIIGWLTQTGGSAMRWVLVLALVVLVYQWDWALTGIVGCDLAKQIRMQFGGPVPDCGKDVFISSTCKSGTTFGGKIKEKLKPLLDDTTTAENGAVVKDDAAKLSYLSVACNDTDKPILK